MLTTQNFEVLALLILFDLKFHFGAFFVFVCLVGGLIFVVFCCCCWFFWGAVQQRCLVALGVFVWGFVLLLFFINLPKFLFLSS